MHTPSTKRLLVVDDAMIMRAIIKDIAKKAGWEVVGEATNGAEAVTQFRELKPDMTTLDIVMPEMDGVEALRAIRGEDPQARVVMISAIDQRAKLNECIQLGALDFIVKPFDKQRLFSLFQTYLTGRLERI